MCVEIGVGVMIIQACFFPLILFVKYYDSGQSISHLSLFFK